MYYLYVYAAGTPPEINNNPFPFKLIRYIFLTLHRAARICLYKLAVLLQSKLIAKCNHEHTVLQILDTFATLLVELGET